MHKDKPLKAYKIRLTHKSLSRDQSMRRNIANWILEPNEDFENHFEIGDYFNQLRLTAFKKWKILK